MALEEAKLMGLELLPDPERNSNAPRDHSTKPKYQFDNRDDHHDQWGSSASESESESELNFASNKRSNNTSQGYDDDLETGGLSDGEIDQLDGKTSSRLGRHSKHNNDRNPVASDSSRYPERETGANTGPKGVIADQRYHQQQQLQERLSTQQGYNARMLSKAPTTTTYRQDKERELQEKKDQGLLDDEDLKALEEEEQDESEKVVLEKIRGKRLQEMSWAANNNNGNKKVFGSLMEMNATQYVNAIDTEKKDVTVIIHIYNEFAPCCKKLDECLIQLAARYATTKFIRIKAREVEFDEQVCPTVLAYRAGDLIANMVMITYQLSENFDDAELEELFTDNKVISPHDKYQRESSFFDISGDLSSAFMNSSLSSQIGDINLMSLGLGVGDAGTSMSSSSSNRRGILSGNVKEFRYQDYDDSDEDDGGDLRNY
ncbi:hypothetical protein BGZ76_010539 [Entomortierella beljakovae]|nr:hypothetical protein BGZ76_010539 [Entomortierella beljakovae]